MRTKYFITILAATVCIISCKKEGPMANDKILLELHNCKRVGIADSLPIICFDSLLTDSRCPANVVCFWQGEASVKLFLRDKNGTTRFKLSTIKSHPYFPANDTTINGYNIKLLSVHYNMQRGTPVPKVQLGITK